MMKQTSSIKEYIEKNQERNLLRWRYKDGWLMFEYDDGLWFDAKHLDELLPVYEYVKFNNKGLNPDKTRII